MRNDRKLGKVLESGRRDPRLGVYNMDMHDVQDHLS